MLSTAGGRVQQPISLYFVVNQISGVKWKQKPWLQWSQGLVYTTHLVAMFFSKWQCSLQWKLSDSLQDNVKTFSSVNESYSAMWLSPEVSSNTRCFKPWKYAVRNKFVCIFVKRWHTSSKWSEEMNWGISSLQDEGALF